MRQLSNKFPSLKILTLCVPLLFSSYSAVADSNSFQVLGLQMTIKAGAETTDGSLSAVHVETPPGSGPPAHIHHRDDELFVVLAGQYRFWKENHPPVDAGPGDAIFLPKGVAHQYRNIGDQPGKHYFITVPGGLDKLFTEIHEGRLQIPEDRAALVELSRKYDIEYVPPLIPD